jgi:hypothetical protein
VSATAIVTVDLARTQGGMVWHIVALPTRERTLCSWSLDDAREILLERDVDAHVVSLKGKPVCARCRGRLQ